MDEIFTYLKSWDTDIGNPLNTNGSQQDPEEHAGHRFWNEIVLRHKDSLKALVVIPKHNRAWCYGSTAASPIQHCSMLRHLTLCLCDVDSPWVEAKVSRARESTEIEFGTLEDICVVRVKDL